MALRPVALQQSWPRGMELDPSRWIEDAPYGIGAKMPGRQMSDG